MLQILSVLSICIWVTNISYGNNECDLLTRSGCLNSPNCTLVKARTNFVRLKDGSLLDKNSDLYICRKSKNVCEINYTQSSKNNRSECSKRKGCKFNPGNCYCNCRGMGRTNIPDDKEMKDCNCYCAFGNPGRCSLLVLDNKEKR